MYDIQESLVYVMTDACTSITGSVRGLVGLLLLGSDLCSAPFISVRQHVNCFSE